MRPSNKLCIKAKRLKIRLTVYQNGRRVYKPEKVLKKFFP